MFSIAHKQAISNLNLLQQRQISAVTYSPGFRIVTCVAAVICGAFVAWRVGIMVATGDLGHHKPMLTRAVGVDS